MASSPNSRSVIVKAAIAIGVAVIVVGCALVFGRKSSRPPIEVERTALVSKDGKLYLLKDSDTPFSGVMLEHYPNGQVQSRSVIVSGILDGVSRGYYTNGQMQVEERFKAGVSDGVRIKWYQGGAKLSEASIRDGKLTGTFRRWHENGTLAEEVQMDAGVPNGISFAYYPSGCLKAEATHENGKMIKQRYLKDGEERPKAVSSVDRSPSSG